MSSKVLSGIVAVIALSMGFGAEAAPIYVDDFSNDGLELTTDTDDGIPSFLDQSGVPSVIGTGDRNGTVFQVSPLASTSSQDTEMFIEVDTSRAFLNSGSNVTSRWTLAYGLDDPNDIDLTDGGLNTHLQVQFLAADVAGTTVKVTATDFFGNSFALTSAAVGTGMSNVYFAFTDFTGIDFTRWSSATYEFNGAPGADHEIGLLIATDPTIPAPLALPAGLALLTGLLLLRRKRLV